MWKTQAARLLNLWITSDFPLLPREPFATIGRTRQESHSRRMPLKTPVQASYRATWTFVARLTRVAFPQALDAAEPPVAIYPQRKRSAEPSFQQTGKPERSMEAPMLAA